MSISCIRPLLGEPNTVEHTDVSATSSRGQGHPVRAVLEPSVGKCQNGFFMGLPHKSDRADLIPIQLNRDLVTTCRHPLEPDFEVGALSCVRRHVGHM